jgi:hypothetical protein
MEVYPFPTENQLGARLAEYKPGTGKIILLGIVLESYRAGNPITFGTLTISPSGISNNNADGYVQLAWGSFDALEIDKKKGDITIYRGGESQPWSTISISDTPNIAVFEALVNAIVSRQ